LTHEFPGSMDSNSTFASGDVKSIDPEKSLSGGGARGGLMQTWV
jgi:hypothetical protein